MLTVSALLLAASLLTAPTEPGPILNPTWSQAPRPISYPQEAARLGLESGSARLNCAIVAGGGLEDCQIVSETPVGAGFGDAALQATAAAKVTTEMATPGARVMFAVRFVLS